MTQEDAKSKVLEMIDRASPERLEAISTLLSLSDERASFYGEALSILSEADFNPGIIRVAVSEIKNKQGPALVRTRTKMRVFNFLNDEDDESKGVYERYFYVKMITTAQKLTMEQYAAEKARTFAASSIDFKKLQNDPTEMVKFMQSDSFKRLLSEPNTKFRDIVRANIVELKKEFRPALSGVKLEDSPPIFVEANKINDDGEWNLPEFILQQLERDLADLIELQGVMLKNSQAADMLGY